MASTIQIRVDDDLKNKSDDGYSFCESLDKSYNKYIVYIKIVDNSGNVKYISPK